MAKPGVAVPEQESGHTGWHQKHPMQRETFEVWCLVRWQQESRRTSPYLRWLRLGESPPAYLLPAGDP